MNKKDLQVAAEFFRGEPGFKRLFKKFIQNYRSLGRLGGTAKLTKPTLEEKEALGGILGQDLSGKSTLTLSVRGFAKALEKTRFAHVDLKELLFAYHGRTILTKREEENEYLETKNRFFQDLSEKYPQETCQMWLEHIQSNKSASKGVHCTYKENPYLLEEQLKNVLEAIGRLPARDNNHPVEYCRLPVFAHQITDDPHAFDTNTSQGRLLVQALGFIRGLQDANYHLNNSPNSEEITELLSSFGIIRDDILNFVTCVGIIADEKDSAKRKDWWQKCAEEGVALNIPLREIIKEEGFSPFNGQKAVFVVENSGVFSEILDTYQDKMLPPPSLICTNGQFKLAALLLFDSLVQNDVTIYYSGDFDPEGLLMAQRLENRHPSKVRLWHYTLADYQNTLSEVVLSENRLNKLKKLNSPQLADVKEFMIKTKRAGYQEKLIDAFVRDMGIKRDHP
jgi:uncharacterized protein (TIGR02679 family)